MEKEFWKITIEKHSWNSWSGYEWERFILYYKVGEKTVPQIGKVFVFDSAANLNNFSPDEENDFSKKFFFIFRGYAENPHRINNIAYSMSGFIDFWRFKKQKKI